MRSKIILVTSVLFALFAFFWISSHGILEINAGSNSESLTVSLLNQRQQKTSTFNVSGSKTTKIVSKANYQVLISQGEKSHFSAVNVGGWLGKTPVDASVLRAEKFRRFIGNNPAPCMYLLNSVLSSVSCGDSLSNLQLHLPANEDTPSYTKKISSGSSDQINGVVKAGEFNVALLYSAGVGEAGDPSYSLRIISEAGVVSGLAPIPGVNPANNYSIEPHDGGFVIYDSTFGHILHYSGVDKAPVRIEVTNTDSSFVPSHISTHGKSLVFAYSTRPNSDDPHSKQENAKTKVLVYSDGKTTEQIFDKAFSKAVLCGSGKLCLLSDNLLEIYDDKVKLHSVSGVQAFESSASGLLVITDSGVINLDADTGSGFLEYSFSEDYKYCGSNLGSDRYVLCLTNGRAQKVALEIRQDLENSGSIDKKVARLLKLREIEDISAYDKYVFITPALGELIYDPSNDDFIYNPEIFAATKTRIEQELNSVGANRQAYVFINTAE